MSKKEEISNYLKKLRNIDLIIPKIGKSLSSFFSLFHSKKLTVQAEVKGVEKVDQAKQKIESLPKTKTVKMKVDKSGDFSALEMTGNNLEKKISVKSKVSGLDQVQQLRTTINTLPKTITVTPPPVGPWSKMNGIFQNLRSGFNNFGAGLKNVSEVFISSGGGAMVLIEGFKSLINIGKHFYGEWINGMKEAAEMSENNASSIREAAQANEELRQKGDSYLAQLEQLASQESLSNANKAEAKKAIGELTKAYGDLGIKLDETTGKLTGVDSAMIKKAEKDKSRRIKELNAEERELKEAIKQQEALRDKAGIPVSIRGDLRLGGKETIEKAGRKIEELKQKLGELFRKRKKLMDSDPAGELRAKKQAETARQEEEYKRRQRAFEDRKHDDAFATETDPAKKIANRQFMLNRHQREVLDPLRKKIAAAEDRVKNTTGDDQTEARRNLIQLRNEEQAAIEKSYGWQKQIEDVRRRSVNAVPSRNRKDWLPQAGTSQQTADKLVSDQPEAALRNASLMQTVYKVPSAVSAQPQKTIDLIGRSGFAGGGMVSGSDKSGSQTDQNFKNVISILQRLESWVREFGKF